MSSDLRARLAEAALSFANKIADAVEDELRAPSTPALAKVRRAPKSRPLAQPRADVPKEAVAQAIEDARRRGVRVG